MYAQHLTDRQHEIEIAKETQMRFRHTCGNCRSVHERRTAVAGQRFYSTIEEESLAVVPPIAQEVQKHIFMVPFKESHGADGVISHAQQQVHDFTRTRSTIDIIPEEHQLIFRLEREGGQERFQFLRTGMNIADNKKPRCHVYILHLPLYTGSRFSRKAATPSRKSSVRPIRRCSAIS